MLGKDKHSSGNYKQFNLNKYPGFNGKKSSLADRKKLAKMYLRKQDRAEWVIERDTATRNGLIQAAWTVQMKMDDQYTAYQLLYVTFLLHHKTILNKVKEGIGDFATKAWKDIW
eukprot:989983-Rhodomonas_salina.1